MKHVLTVLVTGVSGLLAWATGLVVPVPLAFVTPGSKVVALPVF